MKTNCTLILMLLAACSARAEAGDKALLTKEKKVSQQRMMQIYEAIQAYRKEAHDLPRFLSDLYPKFLSDTNVLLCPTALRLNQRIPFDGVDDPKLLTHFAYEFNDRPTQVRYNSSAISMAEWKRMQMMVVGGVVPMLRCFAYDQVLNVSFDGKFYEGQADWEKDQADKIKAGELEPANLRLRVLKDLGVDPGTTADWVELTISEALVSSTLSAGVHPVRQRLDMEVVKSHRQLYELSCVPMSVEFVLKLLGRVPPDYDELQRSWHNGTGGSLAEFDGRQIAGVKFRRQYSMPQDDSFPLNQLFGTIESELEHGRYVIVALPNGDRRNGHAWVVQSRLANGEFQAVSRFPGSPRLITSGNVQRMIRRVHGADILTYEVSDTPASAP